MEQKDQTGNKEYQFIREKVVSRRRSRMKKMILSLGFTVFLAMVFGVVARAVFLCADGPVRWLLGLENEPGSTPAARPTPTKSPVCPGTTVGAQKPGTEVGQHGTPPLKQPTPSGGETSLTGEPSPSLPATVTPGEGEPSNETATPGAPSMTPGVPVTGEPSPSKTPTGEPDVTQNPSEGENGEEVEPTQTPSFAEQYCKLFTGMQEVAKEVGRSLVTVSVFVNGIDWLSNPYETESQTTGIIIGQSETKLLLLVNLDRIQSASRICLTVDKEHYEAELWSYDRDYNLAVVRIDTQELPEQFLAGRKTAVFGESYSLTAGTPVLALGNPNGYVGSMDFGMVTSKQSVYYITDNSVDLFNTSTVDSEDGDGVIVNLTGEIIGIITRTMKSGFDESMCTAVGSTKLKAVISRLAAGQKQVYFGIRGEDVPQTALVEQGLDNGIYVMEVETDSPAFEAGIKTGDIITKVDNTSIYSFHGFNAVLNQKAAGLKMEVTLWRTVRMKAEEIKVIVVLGER
ncbi:MAG: PDZ domain-containing protein [Lachnospiraceae bacterium]|nr:PDZ domain-containing protein [Lachnospiraceae bacterium]